MRVLQTLVALVVLITVTVKHVNGATLSGTTSRYTSEEIQRNRNSIPPEVAKIVSSLVSLLPDDVEEQLRKGGFNVYVEKSNGSGPEVYYDTAKNGKDLMQKKTQEGMQNFGNAGQRLPSLQAKNIAFNIGPIPPAAVPKRKDYWVGPEPLVRMPVPIPQASPSAAGVPDSAQIPSSFGQDLSLELNFLQMRLHDRTSMTIADEDKTTMKSVDTTTTPPPETTSRPPETTSRPPVLEKPPKFIRIGDAVDNAIPFPKENAASLLRRAIAKLKALGPSPIPVLPKQTKKPNPTIADLPPLFLTPHGITAMGIPFDIVGGKLRKREAVIQP